MKFFILGLILGGFAYYLISVMVEVKRQLIVSTSTSKKRIAELEHYLTMSIATLKLIHNCSDLMAAKTAANKVLSAMGLKHEEVHDGKADGGGPEGSGQTHAGSKTKKFTVAGAGKPS